MQPDEREPNSFCEVAGQKCYLNYCDENGCQDRKRNYTAFGISLLNDRDLLKHLQENIGNEAQVTLCLMEASSRLTALRATAAQPQQPQQVSVGLAGGAWVPVGERLPEAGRWLVTVATDSGPEVHTLELDRQGDWIHDGEPTYCHGYYFCPTHWQPITPPADAPR